MDRHKQHDPILSQHGCFQLHHALKRHRCGRGYMVTFVQISKLASRGDHWTGHREHPNSRVLISTSGQPLGSQWELLQSPPGDQASLVFPVLAAWLVTQSFGEQGHGMKPYNLLTFELSPTSVAATGHSGSVSQWPTHIRQGFMDPTPPCEMSTIISNRHCLGDLR